MDEPISPPPENEQKKGVCIASFDGGGPGSLSQLLFMRELMTRLEFDLDAEEGTLRPADFFRLMGGVGFGGFCALLLGRLRMTPEQAIEALVGIGKAVFSAPALEEVKTFAWREENMSRLRKSLKEMLLHHGYPVDLPLREAKDSTNKCHVVVFAATTVTPSQCHSFRTWRSRKSGAPDCTFVDTTCAILAQHDLFCPVLLGPAGRQQQFIGTPFTFHNPIRPIVEETRLKFEQSTLISLVLSIGAGRTNPICLPDSEPISPDALALLLRGVQSQENVAEEMCRQFEHVESYVRLNIDRDLGEPNSCTWYNLGPVESYTDAFMTMQEVDRKLDQATNALQGKSKGIDIGALNRVDSNSHEKIRFYRRIESLAQRAMEISSIVPSGLKLFTLVDAVGNRVSLSLEWCMSYEMLADFIGIYFKYRDLPGRSFVERGNYHLVHGDDKQRLDSAQWTYTMKPNLEVEMCMEFILHLEGGKDKAKCPKCQTALELSNANGRWSTCPNPRCQVPARLTKLESNQPEHPIARSDFIQDEKAYFRLVSLTVNYLTARTFTSIEEQYNDDDDEYDYEEENGDDEEEEDEDDPNDHKLAQRRRGAARGPQSRRPNGREAFFNFGSLTAAAPGNILTVADDLLKNDGGKFLEMMEQLAERRMQRDEEATKEVEMKSDEEDENVEGSEDGDGDGDDDDQSDEDEDIMSEEQNMEEGRKMFSIFAARMFEQRVLNAYREKVAAERQEQLLRELEATGST